MNAEEKEKLDEDLERIVKESEFSEEGKRSLKEILNNHKKVFIYELRKPGRVGNPVKLERNEKKINHQQKRFIYPASKQKWMQEKVDLYEKFGLCRKLKNNETVEHIANLVGIESNKKKRITQDFSDLNEGTVDFKYPLRRPEEVRMCQGESKFFSTLDEIDCYFQHPLEKESQQLTAFYGPGSNCVYVWNVMPQGIKQAPAVLHQHKDFQYLEFGNEELNYTFDDTLLMSKDEKDHLKLLERFLIVVEKAGERLKPTKCNIGKKRVKFSGFIVSEKKWEKDNEAVNLY